VGSGIGPAFELARLSRNQSPFERLHPSEEDMGSGAKIKAGGVIVFIFGLLALASGQENQPASGGIAASIGLGIGQRAPAFELADQFGHEQSNETLKGSKGTVLLFLRSADW
jgi:hypothetical protein